MDTLQTPTPSRWRGKTAAIGLAAAGAVAGGVLASTLTASAADTTTPSTPTYAYGAPLIAMPNGARPGGGGPMGGATPMRSDETQLTGSDAAKAKAAALDAVPGGTVYRVETDAGDAAYEAHMTKSDGTPVTVKMDKNFTVTAVEACMGKGDPRPSGAPSSSSSPSSSASST
jgi:hypothetical protein